MTVDQLIAHAARAAAPVFAAHGWQYHRTAGNGHVPDAVEIALLLRHLVNSIRDRDIPLDEDGYGEMSTGSGRFTVTRVVDHDGADDLSISLDLGEVNLAELRR